MFDVVTTNEVSRPEVLSDNRAEMMGMWLINKMASS
jgi:hypothetical protein